MQIDYAQEEIKISDFNAHECFRIARKIELESVALYRKLAEKLAGSPIGKTIETLLEEERAHLRTVETLLEKTEREPRDGDLLVDYMDSHVVSPLYEQDDLDAILCNRAEAIRLGLSVEKRALAFYTALLESTTDPGGREALEGIIEEERKHAERLRGLM